MNAIKSFLEHLRLSGEEVRSNPTKLPWIRPCWYIWLERL